MTVNVLLPGGASRTGMIPDEVPLELRKKLISPEMMVALLHWLVSDADEVSCQRLDASHWDTSPSPSEAAAKYASQHCGALQRSNRKSATAHDPEIRSKYRPKTLRQ